MKKVSALMIVLVLLVIPLGIALADGTVTYTGQGFTFDGTTWTLNSQRCGLEGQGIANDGGTGQFANNLPPFENGFTPGDPYLVWVLTVNGATSATLRGGPFGAGVSMYQVGGTYKYASLYYSPDQLINIVSASWTGGKGKAQLTVSHGCPPRTGGWCSPGFWRNATDAAWALTGYARTDLFNNTVVPNYYDTASAANPTLIQVLTTPGANTFGAASGPFGLNAFNATGAFLTDQLVGGFDPSKVGVDGACQIDHFGNYKP